MTALVRPDQTVAVYQLLKSQPRLNFAAQRWRLPENGIYLFFERGELTGLADVATDRIVRVGTHDRPGRFRGHIRQHFGNTNDLGGDKNSSVFRKHVGGALLRKENPSDPRLASWLKQGGTSYPEVEEMVSHALRLTFSFACFSVESAVERRELEKALIGLLAQRPLGSSVDDVELGGGYYFPIGDDVTQVGQGSIPDREHERLGTSDSGLILLRKLWQRDLRALAEGRPLKEWKHPAGMLLSTPRLYERAGAVS